MEYTKDLHELCETLGKTIKEANDKIRKAGGQLTAGDVAYIDQLTHALKSTKAVMAMAEEYSNDGGSYRGGSYEGGSNDGGSYYYHGKGENSYRGNSMSSYRGGSYRGGSYDGRGSREGGSNAAAPGYSRNGQMAGMIEELRNLTDETPDERTRRELHQFIEKLEQLK